MRGSAIAGSRGTTLGKKDVVLRGRTKSASANNAQRRGLSASARRKCQGGVGSPDKPLSTALHARAI